MGTVNICKVCKEPIWNFICIDCLAGNVQKCLPGSFPSSSFSAFHSKFRMFFSSAFDARAVCIRCKNPQPAPVCMHCYITEVLAWLKDRSPELVSSIQPLLNYDFDKHEEFIGSIMAEPITWSRTYINDSGICDECGEYSEELSLVSGQWMCRECVQGVETDE